MMIKITLLCGQCFNPEFYFNCLSEADNFIKTCLKNYYSIQIENAQEMGEFI